MKKKDLMIPAATDDRTAVIITSMTLQTLSDLELANLRREATASASFQGYAPRPLRCIGCHGLVYPCKGNLKTGRRPHWKHRSEPASLGRFCPYDKGRKLDEDGINKNIFDGRQESKTHRDFVRLLHALATADPGTAPGAPNPDTYFKPVANEHGLFPDVRFNWESREVVIEAQLATIALITIDKRRSRYEKGGVALIWVMKHFDPSFFVRSSVFDIAADQLGIIFDMPDELVDASKADGRMRVRGWQWTYEHGWKSSSMLLGDAIASASPVPWHRDFKRRWIEVAEGKNFYDIPHQKRELFNDEVIKIADLNVAHSPKGHEIEWMRVINVLIAVESGKITGYKHRNLIALINSIESDDLLFASGLIKVAVLYWQPNLIEKDSVKKTFSRIKQTLSENSDNAWTRKSDAGLVLNTLFPDLVLSNQTRK